jgi:hypothetical protein
VTSRRFAGQSAGEAQNRRIASLTGEIEALHRSLRDAQEKTGRKLADVVTREDLKGMRDSIKEVDDKRLADNKQMLEAIEKMVKEIAIKTPPPVATSTTTNTERADRQRPPKDVSTPKQSTNTNNELVYTHTVGKGENLSLIISEYNKALKEKEPNKAPITLDMVRRANPKINLNNIFVGQEILIPVPPDKK